ncbi:hypothetical protein ACSDR0_43390 [Streptosporangium sp. G11]|uniref:hypothetical protein n=1 Tax=Streptosporangium sp. G11 TaxID=3436926 RepID=UPI003EC045ED
MSAVQQLDRPAALAVPAAILAMPNGEWAMALYASDMPTRRGDHTAEQIAAWIVQGVERLGGEVAVWQRSQEFAKALDIRDQAKRSAAWKRLFPKPRREDRARGLAYGLSLDLRQAGVQRRFPMVLVDHGTDEIGQHWASEVPARDVEMYERATGEAVPLYQLDGPRAVTVLVSGRAA